jgi:hypothetical protein
MTSEGLPAPVRSPQKIIADAGLALMRAADTYRSHGGAHPLAAAALQRVYERLSEATTAEPLQLEVTLGGLLHGERPFTAPTQGRKQDALATPLFSEGVRRITFLPGLPLSELEPLLRAWFDAASGHASSEGVTTYFWESEPKFVLLIIIDVFALGEDATSDDTRAGLGRALSAKDRIDALVAAIASRGLSAIAEAGSGPAMDLARTHRVGSDDIALLRAEGLREITAESLAKQDVTAKAPDALSDFELSPLTDELTKLRAQKGAGFSTAVLYAAAVSEEPDRSQLAGRLVELGRTRLDENRFKDALDEYQRLVELAKMDAAHAQAHTAVLMKVKNQLVSDATFDKLMAAIDTEAGSDEALAFLETVRKPLEQKLVAALPKLRTENGRKAVAKLVSGLLQGSAAMAAQVKTMNATMFAEVLGRVKAMTPEEQVTVLTEAFHNHDAGVRRAAMGIVTPELVMRLGKAMMQARLGDTDAGVRAAMRKIAAQAEDPNAVAPLVGLMKRPSTPPEEKKAIMQALASIPGPDTLRGLLDEAENEHDSELRVAAIHALSELGDVRAKAPLETIAGKLLTAPSVKAAAREAVARITAGAAGR